MNAITSGAFRIFRLAGINVYLHWSWFLVAAFEVRSRRGYTSLSWNVIEYLALFVLVLLHEFGHSLACRQVGGTADRIVLWPLGGIAYVSPPQRPGAMLWSIAAGPLVNVALLPILYLADVLCRAYGWHQVWPDAYALLRAVWIINVVLLVFNLLPIYPLDGGKIMQSLLWFVVGRSRSLFVTVIIGFVGVAGLLLVALALQSIWIGIVSVFILLSCWGGLQQARILARMGEAPRRLGFACPECKAAPLVGPFWGCGNCRKAFDTFATQAVCPHCNTIYPVTRCPDCGAVHPLSAWAVPFEVPPQQSQGRA